jgi:hypothetical protein
MSTRIFSGDSDRLCSSVSLKIQFSNMFVIPQTASTGCFFMCANTLHETPSRMITIHLKVTDIDEL